MDKAQKFELMNKVVRELEDLQNSLNAVIEKMGKLEVDNINGLNDKRLETDLSDMYSRTAQNVDGILALTTYFETKTEEYGDTNRGAIDAAEAAAAIENAK
ncbi:MAG: hypothetical protein H7319_21525 [Spirosoma sp.]|nr:hypothetical protein [Spirosoma sp.]